MNDLEELIAICNVQMLLAGTNFNIRGHGPDGDLRVFDGDKETVIGVFKDEQAIKQLTNNVLQHRTPF